MYTRIISALIGLAASLQVSVACAQAAEPTKGGEVNIVRVTATTMELQFGMTGTGQGRVVAMAATPGGAPMPLVAANDQFYTGSAAYGRGSAIGAGFVVYNGTGHSVMVTGLRPSTFYYITNAEYNQSGPSITYNTRSTSISVATAAGSPLAFPLPVVLTSFTGSVDARGTTTLRWTTATEQNSEYFALERSADGLTFATAGQVPAAGNSMQPLSYQWADPQPVARRTYYRLRQVDRDAAMHYSPVVMVTPATRQERIVEVYPNPSAGQDVQVSLQSFADADITLHLTDVLGRTLLTQHLTPTNGQSQTTLPMPVGLAAGTYLLTCINGGSPIQKRITVSY